MATLTQEDYLMIGGAGAIIVTGLLLSRAGGGGQVLTTVGPSETIQRAAIEAGIQAGQIEAARQAEMYKAEAARQIGLYQAEAARQVALADLYASAMVNLQNLDTLLLIEQGKREVEREAISAELEARRTEAQALESAARSYTQSQVEIERIRQSTEQQRASYDFFGNLLRIFVPFIKF